MRDLLACEKGRPHGILLSGEEGSSVKAEEGSGEECLGAREA